MKIKQKQWQLFYLGYYGESTTDIDGIWGPNSKAATLEFQKAVGIKDDGIFGTHTRNKTKEMISAIQEVINGSGGKSIVIDGLAGPATMSATVWYQKEHGLTPNGLADEETRKYISENFGPPVGEDVNVPSNETATDIPVGDKKETTGTFWDEIEYFTRDELKCKCGWRYCNGFPAEPQELAVRLADRARKHFGKPAHNVSFLRCPEWNRLQGGVANSQHMYGEAMDIRIDGVSANELYSFMKKQPEVRYTYKINEKNVHFDIPKGAR